jgi:hypothetical protein
VVGFELRLLYPRKKSLDRRLGGGHTIVLGTAVHPGESNPDAAVIEPTAWSLNYKNYYTDRITPDQVENMINQRIICI